jgi:hypothetical protein
MGKVSTLQGMARSWDLAVPPDFEEVVSATQELHDSHAAGEAQKAGPLYDQRLAVEEFVRSLAGDVLLDFNWVETLNIDGVERGYGPYFAGLANYAQSNGISYSTINLTNSIASLWGIGHMPASVVAHEVRHA